MSSSIATDPRSKDFFTPEMLGSPYTFYASARNQTPVVAIRVSPVQPVEYLVLSYELVQQVLVRSDLFSSDYQAILSAGGHEDEEITAIRSRGFEEVNSVLTSDDADHKRLRGLISPGFAPARIRAMNDRLVGVVDKRIDTFAHRGECNFVEEFATWLPSAALATLMGLDDESHNERIQAWAAAITRRFGQLGTPAERIADELDILDAKTFMKELVAERRLAPGSDLVSDLLTAQYEDESKLSELEIFATIFILLVGATETTFSTLIFAMMHLAQHPGMAEDLRADPAKVPLFIEEVLRFYSPIGGFWRIVREDMTFGNIALKKNNVIMARLDSANRDPEQFVNPEVFDIYRKNNARHFAFGGGAHSCVGFRLAKLELGIAVPALLQRLHDLRIDKEKSDLRLLPSQHSRCIRSLHLHFR